MKTTILSVLLGVVLGLWCSHMHTNFEISLYMIFLSGICIFESTPSTLPNERVSFGARILLPTSPRPSNQSIAMILWTSRRALGGDVRAFQKQGYATELPPPELPYCRRRGDMEEKGQSGSTIPFPSMSRFNMDFRR